MARSDQELEQELQAAKDELRRVRRGAGLLRSEAHDRLTSRLEEIRAAVTSTVAVMGEDLPPTRELLEVHALRALATDEGFEAELRRAIDLVHPAEVGEPTGRKRTGWAA
jgi:hypothetical protein